MCIIVYRPAKTKPLEKEIWQECWRMHGHGAGFAYFDEDGALVTDKGYMQFKPLYEQIKKREHLEMMVHFRTASPGMDISPGNTHPFVFSGKHFRLENKKIRFRWAVVHNGRLPWRSTKEQSDTSCFCDDLLFPHLDRDPWFLDSASGRLMLAGFISREKLINKLCIFRRDIETGNNTAYIINEHEGDKAKGCWFSNTTWRLPVHGFGGGFLRGLHGMYGGDGEDWDGYAGPADVKIDVKDNAVNKNSVSLQEAMRIDEHGWCWSCKNDCWINWDRKHWCTYLPTREAPYDCLKLNKPIVGPSGWKRVHLWQRYDVEKDYRIKSPDDVIIPISPFNKPPVPGKTPITPSEDKGEIVVPRDKDVIDGNVVGAGDEPHPLLLYLSQEEQTMMADAADQMMADGDMGKKDIRSMTVADKIEWMREGLSTMFKELEGLHHADADLLILGWIKAGELFKKIDKWIDEPEDVGKN